MLEQEALGLVHCSESAWALGSTEGLRMTYSRDDPLLRPCVPCLPLLHAVTRQVDDVPEMGDLLVTWNTSRDLWRAGPDVKHLHPKRKTLLAAWGMYHRASSRVERHKSVRCHVLMLLRRLQCKYRLSGWQWHATARVSASLR